MNASRDARASAAALLLLAGLVPAGFGQKVLVVADGGKPAIVRGAEGARPMVEKDGKLVVIDGNRFGLREAPEYVPYIVRVTLHVGTNYREIQGSLRHINSAMDVKGTLESPVPLTNAFVALDMKMDAGETLFLWGVGTMKAGEPADFSLHLPTSVDLGSGQYDVHVFSDGAEVLNSTMNSDYIEAKLEAMVRTRTEGVQNEALSAWVHPSPLYPPDLKKRRVKGSAVISVRITNRGYVIEASVKSATDLAFGQAALVAVRQWQFLPPIKDGVPMAAKADIPFNFN
jgi:TonB family protein